MLKNENLVGIAVKYGISISDIKKANGLLSDNGIFAQDTLLIPLDQRGARYVLISTKVRKESAEENLLDRKSFWNCIEHTKDPWVRDRCLRLSASNREAGSP